MRDYTYLKQFVCCLFFLGVACITFGQQAPLLNHPPMYAKVMNGTKDFKKGYSWHFTWQPVPNAGQYEIHIGHFHSGVNIHNYLGGTSYYHTREAAYVEPQSLYGWFWKVRAEVNRVWGPWSEMRNFEVEPPAEKVEPAVIKTEPAVGQGEPSVEKAEPSIEKAEPINRYGDDYYRIQGVYYQFLLGLKEVWYSDFPVTEVGVMENGNEQALFQFEGVSSTEEQYRIKVYRLPPGGTPKYIGYMNDQMEIKYYGAHWDIVRFQSALQFQVPETDKVLEFESRVQRWHTQTGANKHNRLQYFKITKH